MFNPIVFLRAAREGELLDTIHIVRRVETHGLSLLDIAKHGVRTLVHTLGDQDRLSLVAFHSKAKVSVSRFSWICWEKLLLVTTFSVVVC